MLTAKHTKKYDVNMVKNIIEGTVLVFAYCSALNTLVSSI